MKGAKQAEIRYYEQRLAFWDGYHRQNPDMPDANETARLLGEIVRKIQWNL